MTAANVTPQEQAEIDKEEFRTMYLKGGVQSWLDVLLCRLTLFFLKAVTARDCISVMVHGSPDAYRVLANLDVSKTIGVTRFQGIANEVRFDHGTLLVHLELSDGASASWFKP